MILLGHFNLLKSGCSDCLLSVSTYFLSCRKNWDGNWFGKTSLIKSTWTNGNIKLEEVKDMGCLLVGEMTNCSAIRLDRRIVM